jgi:hypothetical protein
MMNRAPGKVSAALLGLTSAVWISAIVATAARVQAGGSGMSIADFGAIGDGKTDNHDALQTALDTAHSQGKALQIPAGTFAYSGVLHDTGVSIEGRPGKRSLTIERVAGAGILVYKSEQGAAPGSAAP